MSYVWPDSADQRSRINETLAPTLVAEPLLSHARDALADQTTAATRFDVIIELNSKYPLGAEKARALVRALVEAASNNDKRALARDASSTSYVYANLSATEIFALVAADGPSAPPPQGAPQPRERARSIYKIWESSRLGPLCDASVRTIKADAAQAAFSASGAGIVWAVMDSGIDCSHPHFSTHANTAHALPLAHRSFCGGDPTTDAFGHGTHVAGIIAGCAPTVPSAAGPYQIAEQSTDSAGALEYHVRPAGNICGMAPQCGLLSFPLCL